MDDNIMQWRAPSVPPDAKELADRYAIGQLIKIYALGIDMRSYELCRSPFAADAFCDGKVGSMTVDEYLPKTYEAACVYAATQHNMTNQYITVKGDDALMWTYGICYHMEDPVNGRQNLIVGVQYRDSCRRFPQGWLIVRRKAVLQWVDGPLPKL